MVPMWLENRKYFIKKISTKILQTVSFRFFGDIFILSFLYGIENLHKSNKIVVVFIVLQINGVYCQFSYIAISLTESRISKMLGDCQSIVDKSKLNET